MPQEEVDQDAANAPLIAARNNSTIDNDKNPKTSGNWFIWTLTIAAGVSGLLFGYDTGVISSTLVSIGTDLSSRQLTTLDKSLITSCTSFFALLASPLAGVWADKIGRKNIIIVADALFVIGALVQAVSPTVWSMILGRSIVGAAIGGASLITPLYVSELAPSHMRGRLVTVMIIFITSGQVVAYVIGWLFSNMTGGWRWMVGIGAFPAITQLALLVFMPETPRYLSKIGKDDQAKLVLAKVYKSKTVSTRAQVERVVAAIKQELLEEEDAKNDIHTSTRKISGVLPPVLTSLLSHAPHRRALTIACTLQALQQLCGFNSLMYFSATIFSLLSFSSPTLTSLTIAMTNFLFTIAAFHLIDRLGRRRMLLSTVPVMAAALLLAAGAFTFVDLPHHSTVGNSNAPASPDPTSSRIPAITILIALLLYVSPFALGLGVTSPGSSPSSSHFLSGHWGPLSPPRRTGAATRLSG